MANKRWWISPSKLRAKGVLGINSRNFLINRVNSREFYPRVDDKVLTKKICQKLDVPIPETYAVIKRLGDVQNFAELVQQRPEFVVKPARGAGGRGVLVIVTHDKEKYQAPGGRIYNFADVRHRIATILSGLYSLGGRCDKVIVEKRIKPHTLFGEMAVSGTPDIRVILFHAEPILAMLRLPTYASRGCANLHQGAIGVGVNLDTGKTCGGVYHARRVLYHPDTKVSIRGIEIPHWQKILEMTSQLGRAIGLGYLGVDIVLDVEEGPLVLEANARPGLAIQTANQIGLQTKIEIANGKGSLE